MAQADVCLLFESFYRGGQCICEGPRPASLPLKLSNAAVVVAPGCVRAAPVCRRYGYGYRWLRQNRYGYVLGATPTRAFLRRWAALAPYRLYRCVLIFAMPDKAEAVPNVPQIATTEEPRFYLHPIESLSGPCPTRCYRLTERCHETVPKGLSVSRMGWIDPNVHDSPVRRAGNQRPSASKVVHRSQRE